ncbi:HORMA domain-containing protein [Thecamonas trahens ATCC 50062]|uniref:HORMA domain-containing protein n=1 Tax=Thecamonas trahens ATCC 50062 TaxID=461836 RepID=A0A0L0DH18_THETB|nr:HORMA domain-containing protein [Thecamonas trahens ATCC 50062]KNC50598.1 HORMA domain-containing protein [Thecamonas trahens ATCC 50062]|eukprot:XP_013762485.1 HORMA domain-containing protein [Thecamonas trahens ATCC 50062]
MVRSVAAAMASATESVTASESLCLVRNLLRCSISTIAYLRSLFPEHCFYDRTLNGLRIKSLKPSTDEAQELCNWLEQGVFPALKLGYIDHIILGVYEAASDELVESYHFQVQYPSGPDGLPRYDAATPAPATDQKEIKFSTITMMRTLTLLCQTLQPLVVDRYIMMRVIYSDTAPPDYEPLFFQPAPANEPMFFTRKPLEFAVGSVRTHHHVYDMGMRTVLDGLADDEASPPVAPAKLGVFPADVPLGASAPSPSPSPLPQPPRPRPSPESERDELSSLEADTRRLERENAALEAELARLDDAARTAGPRIVGGSKRVTPPPPTPPGADTASDNPRSDAQLAAAVAFLAAELRAGSDHVSRRVLQDHLGLRTKDQGLAVMHNLRDLDLVAYSPSVGRWMLQAAPIAAAAGKVNSPRRRLRKRRRAKGNSRSLHPSSGSGLGTGSGSGSGSSPGSPKRRRTSLRSGLRSGSGLGSRLESRSGSGSGSGSGSRSQSESPPRASSPSPLPRGDPLRSVSQPVLGKNAAAAAAAATRPRPRASVVKHVLRVTSGTAPQPVSQLRSSASPASPLSPLHR